MLVSFSTNASSNANFSVLAVSILVSFSTNASSNSVTSPCNSTLFFVAAFLPTKPTIATITAIIKTIDNN